MSFILDSINAKSLPCPTILETLAERVIGKKNAMNKFEFPTVLNAFTDAEFPYERYYEHAAEKIIESAD